MDSPDQTPVQRPLRRSTAVVTGYGPFKSYSTNPSYEAVRPLQGCIFPAGSEREEVMILAYELPVEYDRVHALIPAIYTTNPAPKFFLHVGVSHYLPPATLCLETFARRGPYTKCDVIGRCPPGNVCADEGEEDDDPNANPGRDEWELVEGRDPCGKVDLKTLGLVTTSIALPASASTLALEKNDPDAYKTLNPPAELVQAIVERVRQRWNAAGLPHASAPVDGRDNETIEEAIQSTPESPAPAKVDVSHDSNTTALSVPPGPQWQIHPGTDAGLFLCEYVLYRGLSCSSHLYSNNGTAPPPPVFFVHVPSVAPEGTHRSQEELGRVVEEVVRGICEVVG
ncbi:uncharacterized protein EV422DRAFT_123588 [Fimicolochytrium jonesii]|uniref:uncharacterized protein n=1 Tax=Fimicolochytrium jonesii TaxID=1396493 RepID=UPI0022FE28AA|nr:uncharacterized protein EV422DRAFT_123588 [Fimicolochytrium jonesii]KAI8818874.1 hypothetical protein EV422DRAFT_123588 [Fimicolochytrium jonesii]